MNRFGLYQFCVFRLELVDQTLGDVTCEGGKNWGHAEASHSAQYFMLEIDGERMPT